MGDVRAVEAKTEVPLIKDVGSPQKKLSLFIYFSPLPFLLLIFAMLFAGLADGTVNAATDSPEVRVGSELEFPPYAFVDERGQPAGFSVDLIKAVADVMSLSIKISTGPWDTVWKELVAGRIDVLPVVAKSPERQRLVDFSLAHTETYDAFFVRKGNPQIQNIAAARGKEIIVMRSDAAHHALLERNFQSRLILVETIPAGLSLIASGKHDAFLCSKLIGTMVIKEHELKNLAAGPLIPDYKRVFSFAVKKGDTELLDKLNQGLLIIKTTHEYDRIYEKWLTSDDPWWKFKKYLWPAIAIVTAIALIAGCWLVMLQMLVKKRTRALMQAVEQLKWEEKERLVAEKDLRESEERYRLLAENVTDVIWTVDMNIEITFVSSSIRLLLGLTPAEAAELGTKNLLTPASYELAVNTIHEEVVLATQEPVDLTRSRSIELEMIHKGGFTIWAEVKFTFLRDLEGQPVGLVGVTRDITERKRMEEALKNSERRLHYLTSQLLTTQERERKRISHELHDDMGQSLMVLKMQMRAVERKLPPDLRDAMDGFSDALNYVDSIIDNIRRISQDLRPSILEDMGLSTALRRLFDEFCKRQEIEYSLDMDDIENSFSPEAEINIYRIIQEVLTNIGKHAQAKAIEMAIKKCGKSIHFNISDNGTGFELEQVLARTFKGMGLESMEERLRMLDGTLELWSEKGKGTKISFILPINIDKTNEGAPQRTG